MKLNIKIIISIIATIVFCSCSIAKTSQKEYLCDDITFSLGIQNNENTEEEHCPVSNNAYHCLKIYSPSEKKLLESKIKITITGLNSYELVNRIESRRGLISHSFIYYLFFECDYGDFDIQVNYYDTIVKKTFSAFNGSINSTCILKCNNDVGGIAFPQPYNVLVFNTASEYEQYITEHNDKGNGVDLVSLSALRLNSDSFATKSLAIFGAQCLFNDRSVNFLNAYYHNDQLYFQIEIIRSLGDDLYQYIPYSFYVTIDKVNCSFANKSIFLLER